MAVIKNKNKHTCGTTSSLQTALKQAVGWVDAVPTQRLVRSGLELRKESTTVSALGDQPIKALPSFQAFTAAALLLPGLLPISSYAAEDDTASFGYQYYQEGERTRAYLPGKEPTTIHTTIKPIAVDSIIGKSRISLTDRIKLAFNYVQDTWGGATPILTGPIASLMADGIAGASMHSYPRAFSIDEHGNYVATSVNRTVDKRIAHLYASASPETRQQGDLKLAYEGDEMAAGIGGGVSEEPDYHSRFINANARWDFNQKLTSLNLAVSHTNSDIGFNGSMFDLSWFINTPRAHSSGFRKTFKADRQDWAMSLGLSQILTKNTVLQGGMNYTQSTGFLENPYKAVLFAVGSNTPDPNTHLRSRSVLEGFEQRPDSRNQFNWNMGIVQYVVPVDAALHLDYSFAHDDWGINAHTFAGAWDQPLGGSWILTPNIRYYSQTAADFYQPFFTLSPDVINKNTKSYSDRLIFSKFPFQNFSSDYRLSGYGALSGGLTINKQFAKGLSLAIGGEYYHHAGSLMLGGQGEGSYADFNYFTVNASLNVNLDALSLTKGGGIDSMTHAGHSHHGGHAPAAVMFDHILDHVGEVMVGYRYQGTEDRGGMLHGANAASDQAIIKNGCPDTNGCRFTPTTMTMNMHMLELMVAPTDWLTLMLMPQFMDMDMNMRALPNAPRAPDDGSGMSMPMDMSGRHTTAGIGDTGLYALVKLFNNPLHHLHAGIGISAPSGSVTKKMLEKSGTSEADFIHYGMQIGSGTWDFKPSITYTGHLDDWSWGAQLNGTKRLENKNESGYALGDLFQTTAWGSYQLLNWLSASARGVYTVQGSITNRFNAHKATHTVDKILHTNQDSNANGHCTDPSPSSGCDGVYDPNDLDLFNVETTVSAPNSVSGPMDEPGSYGGQYVDVGLGLSVTVPSGSLEGNRLSVEWLQPAYTHVNGYQLDRQGTLAVTWDYGF